MANTEPARRPPYRRRPLNPEENFRESLAQPVPNRTYRSQVDLTDTPATPIEQIVRLAASLLSLLLALRFITNLLTSNSGGGWVHFINSATNWLVTPFKGFIPQPSISSGGTFDWPALVALLMVAILATILVRLTRHR
jgi:uncharacterized protein YggT (Ycf19 family)